MVDNTCNGKVNKMKKSILFLSIVLIVTVACKKHKYKACLSADKLTAAIGDTITFSNCSDFDGGYTDSHWLFGDGTDAYSKAQASVTHKYTTSGQYTVTLKIGEKENGSDKTILLTIQ